MKIQYKESKDGRINARRSFLKEYLIIWGVMLVCCSGAVLMYDYFMTTNANPWFMALCISSYVLFMCLLVSLGTRYLIHHGFHMPMNEIAKAARKVAEGDFTVRIRSLRQDDKKDVLEVLIDDFNKMVEELATIETLKTDFIANISHEIKTPLAIIQSYVHGLKKENISKEEKLEYIDTILDASKKLTDLVSNVLRLNKLENQEIIQTKEYMLDEQLRCCIVALEDKLDEKDLNLDIDLDEVAIHSDEGLLEIVWNNLLNNAIKFTAASGTISISLKRKLEKIIVTISDTGCGMDENTCKHIFDRFYQGDTSHSSQGNGLGLALVKRVADLVQAEINVRSTVGEGTTFTVIFNKNIE